MLRALLAVLLLALAGCQSSTSAGAAAEAMPADLFPLDPSSAQFDAGRGRRLTIRVEGLGDGRARMTLGDPSGAAVDVVRTDTGLVFRNGPDEGAELVRFGAVPGDEWQISGGKARFAGWERIQVAAGTYDAARVQANYGADGLDRVDTWWFARGVGLIRLKSDWGELFSEELVRVSP